MLEEIDKKKLIFSGILITLIAALAVFFLFFNQKQISNTNASYSGTYEYAGTFLYRLDDFDKDLDSESLHAIMDFSSDFIDISLQTEKNANRERNIVINTNETGVLNCYSTAQTEKELTGSYDMILDYDDNTLSIKNADGESDTHKFKIIDNEYLVLNYESDSSDLTILPYNEIYKKTK